MANAVSNNSSSYFRRAMWPLSDMHFSEKGLSLNPVEQLQESNSAENKAHFLESIELKWTKFPFGIYSCYITTPENRVCVEDAQSFAERHALKKIAERLVELEQREERWSIMRNCLLLTSLAAGIACGVVVFPYVALQIVCGALGAVMLLVTIPMTVHCRHLKRELPPRKVQWTEKMVQRNHAVGEHIQSLRQKVAEAIKSIDQQIMDAKPSGDPILSRLQQDKKALEGHARYLRSQTTLNLFVWHCMPA